MPNLSPGEFTPRQIELCQRVLPTILEYDAAYYSEEGPHPYLKGLASGGLIFPTENTRKHTDQTVVEATGLRDSSDYTNDKFTKIGFPEDVARNGLIWAVSTDSKRYLKNSSSGISDKTDIDHAFVYWDGSAWLTRRIKKNHPVGVEWDDKWEPSSPTETELDAIRVTAQQTSILHEIAEVFEGNQNLFAYALGSLATKESDLLIISRSIATPTNTHTVLGPVATAERKPFMRHHYTGFQWLTHIQTIRKLEEGRSFSLDSGALNDANYHRPGRPSDPEMLAKGENIVLKLSHPPVSSEMAA